MYVCLNTNTTTNDNNHTNTNAAREELIFTRSCSRLTDLLDQTQASMYSGCIQFIRCSMLLHDSIQFDIVNMILLTSYD